ncbi:hypothetical protein WI77_00325 [Burkholderia ubonensis]|uniref:DUF1493 family protein n=1 Tax=Burkholderia ubonensis TaxID=101571 RepID=UPI000756BA90|nr:DUF1493 family protein [Burkholderia ubonensis]KVC99453.1 hypothetical protein WI77_00325 [Burkholderia ubonensis]
MENYSWEDLELFVRKEACISPKKVITRESTVEDDLGQQGDDADLFMQRFFEAFRVDRGDYDFHHYFLMEGEGIFYHLLMKLLRKPHTFKRETLTVGMLHRALANGKWDTKALSELSPSR